MLDKKLRDSLRQVVGEDRLLDDPDTLRLYSGDLYSEGARCAAVLRPRDEVSLAAALRATTAAGLAVVPRGGGLTYVTGYTRAVPGHVVVDTADLNRIVEVNAADRYITVQAGVTWKQINDALSPLDLRLPFFGTFSGAGATIGGGLSNGAMFLGSARYGSAAEIVLSLQVALADGTLLETGQMGIERGKPFYRTYGPDLTGLFVHDAGALGIKTRATFRVMRKPAHLDYLSFLVPDVGGAIRILSDIARDDLVEEIYIVDPIRTRMRLKDGSIAADLSMLAKVVGQERGLLRGLKSGIDLIRGGRDFLDQDLYSVHMVCAGRSEGAVAADVAAARAIGASHGGTEIPNSIPKAGRAEPFPDLGGVLGTEGDRWVALNCKVAHSDAERLVAETEAVFARHAQAMKDAGVVVTLLISGMSNHVFSYECVFRWFDSWLPLHRSVHPKLRKFSEPRTNEAAREVIARVRQAIVDCFHDLGAASTQIGRTYRYFDALKPAPREMLRSIKALVDPDNLMNPGALGSFAEASHSRLASDGRSQQAPSPTTDPREGV